MPNPAHQWRVLLGGIPGKRLRTQKGIEAEASPSRSFSQGSVTWFSLCMPLRRGQEGVPSIAFSPFPSMIISNPVTHSSLSPAQASAEAPSSPPPYFSADIL